MDYRKNVRQSIDFIEQHLAEDIKLEHLAEMACFSKYHFHRIFKTMMGKTLMEYVRERRLRSAAHELIYSSRTIMRIAFDWGFNSQDAFDKAFKRMYGITPKQYRGLNLRMNGPFFLKGDSPMNDAYLNPILHCTLAEKKECLSIVDRMMSLSQKQHQQGLLSLEMELNADAPFLLQKGLQLMLSGIEPLMFKEILSNYIFTSQLSEKNFLAAILIKEGLLAIQMGEYPWEIRERLLSFFGMDFYNEIAEHFGIYNVSREIAIQNFIEAIKDNKACTGTIMLDPIWEKLDQRSLQRILRELDIIELVSIMKAACGKTQLKIIDCLPKSLVLTLIEAAALFSLKELNIPQIVDAQNHILQKIKQLKVEGEVQ
ncbi:MAG TPA: hypothetical protein DDW50_02850 [Firmicutes bacterium]|jgi:AraC-like DNA-binding protein|nr:hypothetical protein [Bacillota bacterium]